MQPNYLQLFLDTFAKAGYSQEESVEQLKQLNVKMNVAVVEEISQELTSEEQKTLLKEMEKLDIHDGKGMDDLLMEVCKNSVNHLDGAKLANKGRTRILQAYIQDVMSKIKPEEKEALLTRFDIMLARDPDIAEIAQSLRMGE